MAKPARYVKTIVPHSDKKIVVYAGKRFDTALQTVMELESFYALKIVQLIEGAYAQGKKDGAREVSEQFQEMMKQIPHLNPGRPTQKKKKD